MIGRGMYSRQARRNLHIRSKRAGRFRESHHSNDYMHRHVCWISFALFLEILIGQQRRLS